ncbi:MAG: hypothetical protein U0230_25520 [Polyangiales bacterium]
MALDPHYDAGNVLAWRWWGDTLLRLDFQPLEGDIVQVTKLDDVYPYWPRWLRWCWMSIPMFPHLAETRWRDMGRFHPATLSDGELTATIDALLESIA